MRLASVCGLLLLCVHSNSVDAGNISDRSSSHTSPPATVSHVPHDVEDPDVQRRETNTKRNFSEVMVTKMTASPTWSVSEGVTVVINCTTHTDDGNYSDKMDLQLFWTKMSPRERIKKVLVSQRASKGISYVLSPVTHEHQGVYTCDDDGSFPHVYVRDWHQILWVDDASPRASIDVVSHSRSQFFNGETFSVTCQLPDDDTQWKMMRFNDFVGNITECPNQVSSGRRLSCTVRSEFPWADVLYWCETPAGERSNALNITTMAGVMVALESPSLPVLEGEDVMLRCLHKNRTTNKITSNFGAIFYRNHRRIRVTTEGNLTLTAVTKADEGIYKCRHPVDGPSHESWITIKARPIEDQKKKSDDVIKTP